MSKAAIKILLIAAGAAVLLVGAALGLLFFLGVYPPSSNQIDKLDPVTKEEMLRVTLEWGRLASLPESKNHFQIETEGSAFTREFRSSFTAAREDLEAWIQASPGLQDAQVETVDALTKRYEIQPGGGAQFAQAVIDFQQCIVQIQVCWS